MERSIWYSSWCPAWRYTCPYLYVIVLDYALREAIKGKEEELGFYLEKKKSRRFGPKVDIDLSFEDDIAPLTQQIHQAQELLLRVEKKVGKVGLKMNADKTKSMAFNINPCSPEGFSQTYFPKGGCCNPPWIINTEGHITLN